MTAPESKNRKIGHDVFISYSNEKGESAQSDRQVAEMICAALESQDIRCWIAPRNILPGDDWLNAIIDAVHISKIIVLVFSKNTEQSQWVNDEIKMALDKNIKIIPFRIENIPPQKSLRILNVRCQWLDAFTLPLEKHVQHLSEVVSRHLGIESKKTIAKEREKKPPRVKKQPGADKVQAAKKAEKPTKEKSKKTPDMPQDVKKVISKADKVEKNEKGYWEAYYQDGIIMVYIPSGTFTMGSEDSKKAGNKDEKPLHEVYLDGYWLGKFPVTVKQYLQFVNDTKSHYPKWLKKGRKGSKDSIKTGGNDFYEEYHEEMTGENYPIVGISWHDAKAYCKWLSQKTGLSFRLPTEAQWEKAARGSDGRKYPWGNQKPLKKFANFSPVIGWTTPVGSFPEGVSPYGLLDMAGNVKEWCSDWYDEDYYKNSPQKNPPGAEGVFYEFRVIRGGSWISDAWELRCAKRGYSGPSFSYSDFGFRLCQDI